MKVQERELARKLRQEGMSLKNIAHKLNVAKSSVSLWVRDINLTQEQLDTLYSRGVQSAVSNIIVHYKNKRLEYQKKGIDLIGNRQFELLCMIYWAEGDKSRNDFGISNSDPNLLLYSYKLVKSFYDISDKTCTLTIHCYDNNGISVHDIENYWLSFFDFDRQYLRKTQVNPISKYSKRKRMNTLIYGTCKLRIHCTELVQMIYGGIQELGNFTNLNWLG